MVNGNNVFFVEVGENGVKCSVEVFHRGGKNGAKKKVALAPLFFGTSQVVGFM